VDYIEILQEMLTYIDAHIKEKLNVENLAKKAGFSPYHFYRVFQLEVGYSLMEYVRSRKLFYAVSELASGRCIGDIAFDYGFETHSGFSKAFRRYFGSSPEQYRLYASFNVPKLPVLKKTKEYVNGGIVMEPKIVWKSSIILAGFIFKTKDIKGLNITNITSKLWQECINDGRLKRLNEETFLKNHNQYGVLFQKIPEDGDYEYVIGVEVKEGINISDEYHVCKIPEALYAVFTTPPAENKNFSSEIAGTFKYIFSEWFPSSEYEFDENGAEYCLYEENSGNETANSCNIFIPVVKRRN